MPAVKPLVKYLPLAAGILAVVAWLSWPEKPAENNPAINVRTATVERNDVPRFITALGTVQSPHQVTITPQIDGELKALHFREGEDVTRGQLLAEIDDRRIKAALDQARAEKRRNEALLKTATLTLQRYKNLLKDDAVTPQAVDQQAAEVAQLEASIAAAEANIATATVQLDYTKILAPINGRAGLRRIDAGNIVRASDNSALLTLTQLQPINVLFTLPQDHLPLLQKVVAETHSNTEKSTSNNQLGHVEARLRDGADILDNGQLQTLDNQIDVNTGSVQIKAQFTNAKKNLWPGQMVVVRLHVETLRNALVIPARAIQRGRDGAYIYRVRDNRAELININILLEDNAQAAIEAPALAVNDEVITDGQLRLKPGASVKPAAEKNSPEATLPKSSSTEKTPTPTAGSH